MWGSGPIGVASWKDYYLLRNGIVKFFELAVSPPSWCPRLICWIIQIFCHQSKWRQDHLVIQVILTEMLFYLKREDLLFFPKEMLFLNQLDHQYFSPLEQTTTRPSCHPGHSDWNALLSETWRPVVFPKGNVVFESARSSKFFTLRANDDKTILSSGPFWLLSSFIWRLPFNHPSGLLSLACEAELRCLVGAAADMIKIELSETLTNLHRPYFSWFLKDETHGSVEGGLILFG